MEYVVSAHALPEIAFGDLVPVLRELRRVLAPGGVLRLSVPDVDRVIRAYLDGERDVFLVPDEDAATLAGKFAVQLTWYGYSRSVFTYELLAELLGKAGFREVVRCGFRQTPSPFPEIVELDNRERESMYVEASG
jgi:predicted SAM-dependent methyltransferase